MGLTAGRYYLSQRYEIPLTYYIHLLPIYIDAIPMRLPPHDSTINQDLQAFDLMVSLCTYTLPPKREVISAVGRDVISAVGKRCGK